MTLSASTKKRGRKEHQEPARVYIPSYIFQDRTLSVFEAWVVYLKDKRQLSFKQIALLTNRDPRNIWTVYQRAKKKEGRRKK